MLSTDSTHSLPAENNECQNKTVGKDKHYSADCNGTEVEYVWTYLPNGRRTANQHEVFGIMDGKSRNGKHVREWLDDFCDWCQTDIQTLSTKSTL